MSPEEFMKEIIDLRDRVARVETTIETLQKQQCAIDALVTSVQELALSMKQLSIQSANIDSRLSNIEIEKRGKITTIWNTVVGTGLGIILSFIFRYVLK